MTEPHGQSTPTDPGDESLAASPPTPSDDPAPSAAPSATPRDPVEESSTAGEVVPPQPDTPPSAGAGVAQRLVRVAAVVVVVVVGVIGYLVFFQKSDPTAAKVGDCVSITGSATLATATRLSCTDPSALYVVVAAGKGVTCDSSEVGYRGSARDGTKLCLFYNVAVGDCLKIAPNGDGTAKVACAPGMLKVLSVVTDTADKSTCPADAEEATSDPTRNRLICFATVR